MIPNDAIENYDDNITIVPKPSVSDYTKVPKPYTLEPNGLMTEHQHMILNEDGTQLLMEVG